MRWLKRIGGGILAVLAVTVLAGTVYEMWARHRVAAQFPAPGRLIDIGGRRIHVDCRGTGAPVVVFESGLDLYGSLSWSAVQDPVAQFTRACSYDRAGIMWSDRASGAQDGAAVASDLHQVLQAAGEPAPYVMVGHSLGGPYVMAFSYQFGSDVAGIVFVDASHPDQQLRLKEAIGKSVEESSTGPKVAAALAWTGLPRLATRSAGQPKAPARANAAMAAYLPRSLAPMLDELAAIDATFREGGALRSLGDRPLVVLTAAAPYGAADLAALGLTPEQGQKLQAAWFDLHRDEASWSSRGREMRLEDSHHYIQFERPDAVVAAVREVVDCVRLLHECAPQPIQ
ncbi:MAG TPA: alpha/beta hydrolase [Steroidobacteraceae bacterium]|jgi:pimeloyl-ACP methyl ester carboxylesterase